MVFIADKRARASRRRTTKERKGRGGETCEGCPGMGMFPNQSILSILLHSYTSPQNTRLEEVRKQEQEVLEAQSVPLRNYLMKYVMPTLTSGLIEVCKVRPEVSLDETSFVRLAIQRLETCGRLIGPDRPLGGILVQGMKRFNCKSAFLNFVADSHLQSSTTRETCEQIYIVHKHKAWLLPIYHVTRNEL